MGFKQFSGLLAAAFLFLTVDPCGGSGRAASSVSATA
jgi:hypothetical protein